jgi:hypothetical protein
MAFKLLLNYHDGPFFCSMSPADPPPAKVKVSEIGAIHSGLAKRGHQVVRKAAERDRTFSHYVKPPTAVRDAGGKLQTWHMCGRRTPRLMRPGGAGPFPMRTGHSRFQKGSLPVDGISVR